VGETLAQRKDGVTAELVCYQTHAALAGLSPAQVGGLVIAYEPIWAIGTGKTATATDANTVMGIIRSQVRKTWGDAADRIRIQYGGSMKPGNAAELMAQPEIDGGLIGSASLKADDFAAIVHYQAERNA
jgi:triosephosphate isomerase